MRRLEQLWPGHNLRGEVLSDFIMNFGTKINENWSQIQADAIQKGRSLSTHDYAVLVDKMGRISPNPVITASKWLKDPNIHKRSAAGALIFYYPLKPALSAISRLDDIAEKLNVEALSEDERIELINDAEDLFLTNLTKRLPWEKRSFSADIWETLFRHGNKILSRRDVFFNINLLEFQRGDSRQWSHSEDEEEIEYDKIESQVMLQLSREFFFKFVQKTLPPQYLKVIKYLYFDGLTLERTANLLNISIQKVHQYHEHSIVILKAILSNPDTELYYL